MTHGIHHITMIASDPQRNVDFYTGTLGMRLVKVSVNQDDPFTYHFFYGDGAGTPGSALTFFPYPGGRPAQAGRGMVTEIDLAVPSGSLGFWRERLASEGVPFTEAVGLAGEASLRFVDPDGLVLRLTEDGGPSAHPWGDMPIPLEQSIVRSRGVTILEGSPLLGSEAMPRTESVLGEILGSRVVAEEGSARRFESDPGSGYVDLVSDPGAPAGRGGHGGVHHIAFRIGTPEEQIVLHDKVLEAGLRASPVTERFWFKSVYFREPGGVLFEVATDGPGFTADETYEALGSRVVLPPWLESQRETIERHLPKIEVRTAKVGR